MGTSESILRKCIMSETDTRTWAYTVNNENLDLRIRFRSRSLSTVEDCQHEHCCSSVRPPALWVTASIPVIPQASGRWYCSITATPATLWNSFFPKAVRLFITRLPPNPNQLNWTELRITESTLSRPLCYASSVLSCVALEVLAYVEVGVLFLCSSCLWQYSDYASNSLKKSRRDWESTASVRHM